MFEFVGAMKALKTRTVKPHFESPGKLKQAARTTPKTSFDPTVRTQIQQMHTINSLNLEK